MAAFCFICHRQLGDSYDLMWAGAYTQKLVPVCSEDRECRAMAGQRKKGRPKRRPQQKRYRSNQMQYNTERT